MSSTCSKCGMTIDRGTVVFEGVSPCHLRQPAQENHNFQLSNTSPDTNIRTGSSQQSPLSPWPSDGTPPPPGTRTDRDQESHNLPVYPYHYYYPPNISSSAAHPSLPQRPGGGDESQPTQVPLSQPSTQGPQVASTNAQHYWPGYPPYPHLPPPYSHCPGYFPPYWPGYAPPPAVGITQRHASTTSDNAQTSNAQPQWLGFSPPHWSDYAPPSAIGNSQSGQSSVVHPIPPPNPQPQWPGYSPTYWPGYAPPSTITHPQHGETTGAPTHGTQPPWPGFSPPYWPRVPEPFAAATDPHTTATLSYDTTVEFRLTGLSVTAGLAEGGSLLYMQRLVKEPGILVDGFVERMPNRDLKIVIRGTAANILMVEQHLRDVLEQDSGCQIEKLRHCRTEARLCESPSFCILRSTASCAPMPDSCTNNQENDTIGDAASETDYSVI